MFYCKISYNDDYGSDDLQAFRSHEKLDKKYRKTELDLANYNYCHRLPHPSISGRGDSIDSVMQCQLHRTETALQEEAVGRINCRQHKGIF